jgi:hypothetical protein
MGTTSRQLQQRSLSPSPPNDPAKERAAGVALMGRPAARFGPCACSWGAIQLQDLMLCLMLPPCNRLSLNTPCYRVPSHGFGDLQANYRRMACNQASRVLDVPRGRISGAVEYRAGAYALSPDQLNTGYVLGNALVPGHPVTLSASGRFQNTWRLHGTDPGAPPAKLPSVRWLALTPSPTLHFNKVQQVSTSLLPKQVTPFMETY